MHFYIIAALLLRSCEESNFGIQLPSFSNPDSAILSLFCNFNRCSTTSFY